MVRIRFLAVLAGLLPAMWLAAGEEYRPGAVTPPPPPREFRGAWLVTVANKDWPSKPGLPVAEQKAELVALLDRAGRLKLNAIIFQVRPSSDAVYASTLEPWSEYLTGTMGRAPQPLYDPLAFAIAEAHRRGLELHAWFNPFRALHPLGKSPVAPNHLARTHPELVRRYSSQSWLDPGDPAVRAHVLRVVMDVVRRYDVDGVQFDDYFYPYPEKTAAGRELEFPDGATWQKFGLSAGFVNRDEWRRANVNQFIQSVYQSIKAVKPWVKFGVSPFGIWRPMNPPQIRGMDAYAKIYADSRLWLANGWVDYFAPQLYWAVEPKEQSFPALLNWWVRQNTRDRQLWPGLNASNVGEKWKPEEIVRQIRLTRGQSGAGGEIFYHLRSITDNPALTAAVQAENVQAALVPALPWLAAPRPGPPKLTAVENPERPRESGLSVRWEMSGTNNPPAWQWVLQYRTNQVWGTEILSAGRTTWTFDNFRPEVVAVSAVDRVGNIGPAAAIQKTQSVRSGKNTMILN
jgi:uncharacterized lipoprotein YddW (UPF0748 family)